MAVSSNCITTDDSFDLVWCVVLNSMVLLCSVCSVSSNIKDGLDCLLWLIFHWWLVVSWVWALDKHISSALIFQCDYQAAHQGMLCRKVALKPVLEEPPHLPKCSFANPHFSKNFKFKTVISYQRTDIVLWPALNSTASLTTVTQCSLPVKFLCWSQIGCSPHSGKICCFL